MTGIRHGVGHTPVVHHKKVPQQATPVKKTPEAAPPPLDIKKLSESSDDLLRGIDQGPTAPNVVGATTKGSGIDNHTVTPEEAAKPEGVKAQVITQPFGSVTSPRTGKDITQGLTQEKPDTGTVKTSTPKDNGKLGYIGALSDDAPVNP